MDPDELEPRKPKAALKDLSTLSIEELQDYIASLQAEIARTEAMITSKSAHRGAADAFFKS